MFETRRLFNPAILHGQCHEDDGIQMFMDKTGKRVQPCGLFINQDFSFLAASPDGFIPEEDALIEVKCPFTGRDMEITDSKEFSFLQRDDKGALCLRPRHIYFHQVQGQLAIARKKVCYFVVYTFKVRIIKSVQS